MTKAKASYLKVGLDVQAQNMWLQMYDAGLHGVEVESYRNSAISPALAKSAYEFGAEARLTAERQRIEL